MAAAVTRERTSQVSFKFECGATHGRQQATPSLQRRSPYKRVPSYSAIIAVRDLTFNNMQVIQRLLAEQQKQHQQMQRLQQQVEQQTQQQMDEQQARALHAQRVDRQQSSPQQPAVDGHHTHDHWNKPCPPLQAAALNSGCDNQHSVQGGQPRPGPVPRDLELELEQLFSMLMAPQSRPL